MTNGEGSSIQQHISEGVFAGRAAWESLPEGSVNESWIARALDGTHAIVRIGPSASMVEQGPSWMRANALGCEQSLLHLVRPHLPQMPATIAAGFLPGERPWVVQEMLPGVPFSQLLPDLPEVDAQALWRQVGELLRRLHQVPAPWFGTPDGRDIFPDWPSMVMHDVEGLLRDASRWDLPRDPFDSLAMLVQRHADSLTAITQPRVVHSDLDPRHVFAGETPDGWRISGVIDWEYGRFAEPLSESLLVDMLQRPERNPERIAFLAGYGLNHEILRDAAFGERQSIYRGVALGWEVTDAFRCGDIGRHNPAMAAFRRWANDRCRQSQ